MDLAQSIVRSCLRSFYAEQKHAIVIDALITHSALRDDDLAYLMGMNTKELHKLCGRLKEDRFLEVHTRAEQKKDGQSRPINRTYYYINYRASIDAIKWRVYLMNKAVQGNTVPEAERKEYFCSRCKSEWTQMEVLDRYDPHVGFLCHKCGFVLKHDANNNPGGHEQSTKYHQQFKFITELLPKIDEVLIPENKFEQAYATRLEVIRGDDNPANDTAPINEFNSKPTAVKGMANVGPTSISVTLTKSDGPTDAEIAAEIARKEKNALQNAMPVHFTHSTITGEQVKFGSNATLLGSQSLGLDNKKTDLDTPSANGDATEIDDYFARLKAEQAREAEREKEEEFETDEEDEEDFEDVVATGTPASSAGDAKVGNGLANGLAGVLKRSGSASASGTSTNATSPVTGPGTPAEDGRPAKKVRIEEPAPKDEDESEEDMEFEDV